MTSSELTQRLNNIPCEQSNQPNVLFEALELILKENELSKEQFEFVDKLLKRSYGIACDHTYMEEEIHRLLVAKTAKTR